MAVPVFIPSQELYARWEVDYHMISERTGGLLQGTYNTMNQSARSFNYGHNPNDDFDYESIKRWLPYSDYYYWQGSVTFDSIEDLFIKLTRVDLSEVHRKTEIHRNQNRYQNKLNWQSIAKYLTDEGSTAGTEKRREFPKSFEEGMRIWNRKKQPPDFKSDQIQVDKPIRKWIIVTGNTLDLLLRMRISKDQHIIVVGAKGNYTDQVDILHQNHIPNERMVFISFYQSNNSLTTNILNEAGCSFDPIPLVGVLHAVKYGAEHIVMPVHVETDTVPEIEYNMLWSMVSSVRHGYHGNPDSNNQHQIMLLWKEKLTKMLGITSNNPQNSTSPTSVFNREVAAFLKHWKTDITERDASLNFFHEVDQLNFEMAVQGFLKKCEALFVRNWLLDLTKAGYRVPKMVKSYNMQNVLKGMTL